MTSKDYKDGYADGHDDGQTIGRNSIIDSIRVLAARSRKQAESATLANKEGSARFLAMQAAEYDTLADILCDDAVWNK